MSDKLTEEMALALLNFRKEMYQNRNEHFSDQSDNHESELTEKQNFTEKKDCLSTLEKTIPFAPQPLHYINDIGVKHQNLNFKKKLINTSYNYNDIIIDCSQKIGLHFIIKTAVCNQFTLQSLTQSISKNDLNYVIDSLVHIVNHTLSDQKHSGQFKEQFNLSNEFTGLNSDKLNDIFHPECLKKIFQNYLKIVFNFYGESLPPVMIELFLKMVEYNRKPIRGFELELPIIYVQSLIQTWLKERVYVIMTRSVNPITIKIFKQIIAECNIPLNQSRLHIITSKSYTLDEVLLLEQSGIPYIIKVRYNDYLEKFLPYNDTSTTKKDISYIDDCTCFRTFNINFLNYIETEKALEQREQLSNFNSIEFYNYEFSNPHANDRFKYNYNDLNYEETNTQIDYEKSSSVLDHDISNVEDSNQLDDDNYNYSIGYACVMETEYYPKGAKAELKKILAKLNANKKVQLTKNVADLICQDKENPREYKFTDRGLIMANPEVYATQYLISHAANTLNEKSLYLYNQSNILKVLYTYARRDVVLAFFDKNTLKHDVLVLLASALTEIYNFVDISLREPVADKRANEFRRKNLFKLDYIKIFQKFNNQYIYFFEGNTYIDINSKSSLIFQWYNIDLPSRIAEIYKTPGFFAIQDDIKNKYPQLNINYDPSLAIILTKEE